MTIYLFVIGLAFGSFALAMVDRMKSGEDWVRGRSKCDHCGHKLAAKDLVPIFSWALHKGRCNYCRKKLSVYYPAVELASGTAFLLSYIFVPYVLQGASTIQFVLWLVGIVIMTALTVFDLRWYLLPNKLVYPLISVAALHRIIYVFTNDLSAWKDITSVVTSVSVGAGLFFMLYVVSKSKWIGDGDIRLGVAMGLFLNGPVETWLAIFMASVFGLVLALPMIIKDGKNLKAKIPYGPFLMVGLAGSYLFGSQLIDWYSSTFLYL